MASETKKIIKEAASEVLKEEKAKAKSKAKVQGIADFTKAYVQKKGTGLTLQGKAQRRIKGLIKALQARKWTGSDKNTLLFTKTFGNKRYVVTIDKGGNSAELTTKGKTITFPLGKGAFKSVDYVLTAYGHVYNSAKRVYENAQSVV